MERMWSKEMAEALEADARKLEQLSGECHGPWCSRCLITALHGAAEIARGTCYLCDLEDNPVTDKGK